MSFAVRFPRYVAPVLFAGLPFLGCMGRVDPNVGDPTVGEGSSSGGSGSSSGSPTGSSSGGPTSSSSSGGGCPPGAFCGSSSSGGGPTSSSSSSGGPGNPDCSLLGVPNLARVCPDGTSVGGQYVLSNHQCVLEFLCPPSPPPGSQCTQGARCTPGSGCGSISSNPSACTTNCKCDGSGHYECGVTCPPGPPPPVGCVQGAACMPGEGCGTASSGPPGGCETSCNCDPAGFFVCTTDCVDAGPPPVGDPCPGFPVPDVCMVCSNGTTECAHAILANGQCLIEICPGG